MKESTLEDKSTMFVFKKGITVFQKLCSSAYEVYDSEEVDGSGVKVYISEGMASGDTCRIFRNVRPLTSFM